MIHSAHFTCMFIHSFNRCSKPPLIRFESGRGRTPNQRPPGFLQAANLTKNQDQFFLRNAPNNGLDAVAFHYSIYRALTRFLGMDGNLEDGFDISNNFVTAWNEMMVNNDFLNSNTDELDPRHMYGVSNFDVYRWPSLVNGTQRAVLGLLITTLIMPGIPLVCYSSSCSLVQLMVNFPDLLWRRTEFLFVRQWCF